MSGSDEESARAAIEVANKPLRVLMASPLGRLGIEFHGTVVTRLIIQPSRKEARDFRTLDKVKLSDFHLEALGRLSEYFAGLRKDPEIEVDLGPSAVEGFQRRVLEETCRIAHGRTWTYKKLADAAGQRGAYRLVQSALAQNPIPILIPCHRVIPTKGGVGAYIAGTKKKEKLLKIERQARS